MNANELANALFHYWNKTEGIEISPSLLNDCADILRQQQAEIDELKAEREILFGFVKSRGEVGQLIVYKASLEEQQK